MTRFFLVLYEFFSERKIFLFLIIFVLLSGSAIFISGLKFEEDITRIIPKDEQLDQVSSVFREFDFIDKLVVTISLKDDRAETDPEALISYANSFVDSLENHLIPDLVRNILYRVGEESTMKLYDYVFDYLPIFLEPQDYQLIDSITRESTIEKTLNRNFKNLISPAGTVLKDFITHDPLNFSTLVLNKLKAFQISDQITLYKDYFFTRDLNHLMIFVTPSHTSSESKQNRYMLEKLDHFLQSVSESGGSRVTAEYFGGVAVAVGNASRIKKDISTTVSIAIVLVFLVIGLFFRRAGIFFIIFLPAVFGGAISLVILYFIKYKISAISLAIGSVLLGITIDYSLHFFTHFRNRGSVKKVIRDLTAPILMSSLTTASAFLCLLFIKSDVLNDLAIFAAFSVITAALFSLLVLPHFVGKNLKLSATGGITAITKFTSYPFDYNRYVVLAIIALTVVFVFFFGKVGFEGDMYKMNYMSPEMTKAEANLGKITNLTLNSTYLVTTGSDLNEALRINERTLPRLEELKSKGIINDYTTVSSMLLSDSLQQERIDRWRSYWSDEKKEKVETALRSAGKTLKFNEKAFDGFSNMINKSYQPVSATDLLNQSLTLLSDWISISEEEIRIASLIKLDRKNRRNVYEQFPDDNIIVFDKSLITDKLIEVLKSNFRFLVIVSLVIVFTILLIFLGRIELALICMAPLILSWLWTLGIMGIIGIKFTIFNIIISTFVFGLGIDYSIFIMRGLLQEYKFGHRNLSSYKTSIFLSACTTVIGIGALIFARHPALQSIAAVSIAGILSVIVISYTIQPILFRWLVNQRSGVNGLPGTFLDFLTTIYGLMVVLVFRIIFVIPLSSIYILPVSSDKRQFLTARLKGIFSRCIQQLLFFIKKSGNKEADRKSLTPSIILANIRSPFDQFLLIGLQPMVLFMNNGIGKQKGWLVFLLGLRQHYLPFRDPVKQESSMSELIKKGYSLVWSHGEDSQGDKIDLLVPQHVQRLADKYSIPVVPAIIAGSEDCFPGDSILFRKGLIHFDLLKEVYFSDPGTGLQHEDPLGAIKVEVAEANNRYAGNYKTPGYYSRRLIRNYIYKGPILEWYLRIKLRIEKNYSLFHSLVPEKGVITDLGCGYGLMSIMLSYLSGSRIITGIDYDKSKIEVAGNCLDGKESMTFIHEDISKMELPKSNAFILSDILHYLPMHLQEKLIVNCIRNLEPDGKIIIRDGNSELRSRHLITRLSEFFSTRLGFNKVLFGKKNLYFPSKTEIIEILSKGQLKVRVIDSSRYTSNLIYVAERKIK